MEKQHQTVNENILAGRNPVMEAMRNRRTIDKILVARGEKEGSIIKIMATAKERGIPVIEVEKVKLESLAQTTSHQGVVAYTTPFQYSEIDDILKTAEERGEDPFLLILDGINDPHNFGALIRTAETAGVHGIILPKRNACPMTATVMKSAAGATEYMKIARVTNITDTVKMLKNKNIWVYGADGAANETIYETNLRGPVAIVLGDEGYGISRLVKENCDVLIKIPMKGQISSLNVSVAGALILYETVRQRG